MNKCQFIGIQILLLINIANSYVLFTANIDDVRKLARKFVSESLTEKIADFIARVSQQMTTTNVSEDNEMNVDNFDELSERERKITTPGGIGRQRHGKTSNRKIVVETTTDHEEQNNHGYEMVINKRPNVEYDSQETLVNTFEKQRKSQPSATKKIEHVKPSRNEDVDKRTKSRTALTKSIPKFKNLVKQRKLAPTKPRRKTTKNDRGKLKSKSANRLAKRFDTQTIKQGFYRNEIIYNKKHKLSDNNEASQGVASRQVLTSTLGYAESLNEDQSLYTGTRLRNSLNDIKKNILDSVNSYETSKNGTQHVDLNKTIDDVQKFTIEEYNLNRASTDLTTKKERTEFDQYDNKNYPKAEFVATSGPVALPKLPTEKPWWERAIPVEDSHKDDSRFLN